MKKVILLWCLLMAGGTLFAGPVSGTFNIPGTPYTTIAAAFADLNANGVDGPCVFLIDAGYTENALSLILSVPTASAAYPITFKKNPAQTGANPKIIVSGGSVATTDAGIIIAGTDYVTFEKLDIDGSSENTIEWGYALVKRQNTAPFDGCQYVSINSCNITLNKANTKAVGIYSGNHIATATISLAITATTDACNNCSFDNNTISNVYLGISLSGYAALTPFTLYDHNNSIGQSGGNTISDFGGVNTAAYGIYSTNQDQIKIMNNNVSGGTGSTNRLAGILMQAGTSSSAEVAYNTISVFSSATTSQNTYGIWSLIGNTPASNTVSFHHNNITCTTLQTGTGPMYGILNSGAADTIRIFSNIFQNFTHNANGSAFAIRHDASANNVFINDNTIKSITCNGTGALTLIHSQSPANVHIFNNELFDCAASGGTVYGIYTSSGTNANVYKNKLYNISSNNGSSANAVVYGINNTSTPNITIYNNYISDLKANMATNNPSVCGMYLTGGSNTQVYYNTVYLNASSSGSTFGSAAIYFGSSVMTTLKNNLFINVSTPGATGYTVACRRSGSSLMNYYSPASNNNDFYAGTPGPNNLLYYDGTNAFQTMPPFQALVTPAESVSFTELPPFVNVTSAPYDLHIQTDVATLVESGGSVVASPAITDDFDGSPRFPNAGYPDNPSQPATAPDAGADEFAGGLQTPVLTFHVDLTTAEGFVHGTDVVYIAGDFPGATWNEPGTNPNLLLTRIGTTMVYSVSLQLPNGTYQYKYFKNAGWGGGEYQGGSNRTVTVTGTATQEDQWGGAIQWANLQWPPDQTVNYGFTEFNVYGQVFIPNGITGASGQAYGLQAWVGYSATNTDPSTWTNWVAAPFFGQSWDNDEFKANLAAGITEPGTWYYATRYQFGVAPFVYGGYSSSGGGFWNGTGNVSGVLTVLPAPPVAFDVVGGGNYCQGGDGLPVGISGSETGVMYQLYKDAVPSGSPLSGTGNPISFGNQTAGIYTVAGNKSGVTAPMNGSAVITESPLLPAGITISADVNPVATGASVTFTATPVNGGINPSYQWKVNGIETGPNQPVFTYTPTDFDVVVCILTSSEYCTTGNPATSNHVVVRVLPNNLILENITITAGQTVCYNALQVITVAGNGSIFQVLNGGSATMIAGSKISYLPGTTVEQGGYLLGYISPDGNYCSAPAPMVSALKEGLEEPVPAVAGHQFLLYPNPASEKFTLLQTSGTDLKNTRLEILDLRGARVLSVRLTEAGTHNVVVSDLKSGLYMVRIVADGYTEMLKLVVSE